MYRRITRRALYNFIREILKSILYFGFINLRFIKMLRTIFKSEIMSLFSFRIIKLTWLAAFKPELNIKCLLYIMLSLKHSYSFWIVNFP